MSGRNPERTQNITHETRENSRVWQVLGTLGIGSGAAAVAFFLGRESTVSQQNIQDELNNPQVTPQVREVVATATPLAKEQPEQDAQDEMFPSSKNDEHAGWGYSPEDVTNRRSLNELIAKILTHTRTNSETREETLEQQRWFDALSREFTPFGSPEGRTPLDENFDQLGLGWTHTTWKNLEKTTDNWSTLFNRKQGFITDFRKNVYQLALDGKLDVTFTRDGQANFLAAEGQFENIRPVLMAAFIDAAAQLDFDGKDLTEEQLFAAAKFATDQVLAQHDLSANGNTALDANNNGVNTDPTDIRTLQEPQEVCEVYLDDTSKDARKDQTPTTRRAVILETETDINKIPWNESVIEADQPFMITGAVDLDALQDSIDAKRINANTLGASLFAHSGVTLWTSRQSYAGTPHEDGSTGEKNSQFTTFIPCGRPTVAAETPVFVPTAAPVLEATPVPQQPVNTPDRPQDTPQPEITPTPEEHKAPNTDTNGDGGYEQIFDTDQPVDQPANTPAPLPTAPPAEATPPEGF